MFSLIQRFWDKVSSDRGNKSGAEVRLQLRKFELEDIVRNMILGEVEE
jgi:hypothetical protein